MAKSQAAGQADFGGDRFVYLVGCLSAFGMLVSAELDRNSARAAAAYAALSELGWSAAPRRGPGGPRSALSRLATQRQTSSTARPTPSSTSRASKAPRASKGKKGSP